MGFDAAAKYDYFLEVITKLVDRIIHFTLFNDVVLVSARADDEGV